MWYPCSGFTSMAKEDGITDLELRLNGRDAEDPHWELFCLYKGLQAKTVSSLYSLQFSSSHLSPPELRPHSSRLHHTPFLPHTKRRPWYFMNMFWIRLSIQAICFTFEVLTNYSPQIS